MINYNNFLSSYRPSYYIIAPSYIIPGENTTLAVHWFGDQYSEITVSAGIMTTTEILVNVSKVFHSGECKTYFNFHIIYSIHSYDTTKNMFSLCD